MGWLAGNTRPELHHAKAQSVRVRTGLVHYYSTQLLTRPSDFDFVFSTTRILETFLTSVILRTSSNAPHHAFTLLLCIVFVFRVCGHHAEQPIVACCFVSIDSLFDDLAPTCTRQATSFSDSCAFADSAPNQLFRLLEIAGDSDTTDLSLSRQRSF